MDTFPSAAGWWPAVYPLRGGLGETQYTRIRPTGELAADSALFMPDATVRPQLFARYFRLFGQWPADAGEVTDRVLAELAEQLGIELFPAAVLVDSVLPMSPGRTAAAGSTLTGLDAGVLVARQSTDGHACLLRAWGRFDLQVGRFPAAWAVR
jgi:hypothetical protein